MPDDRSETWLLDESIQIIEQKAAGGYSTLTSRARLIYCLWAADYGMQAILRLPLSFIQPSW